MKKEYKRILLGMLALLVVVLIIVLGRRFIILTSLRNKVKEYSSITNYYISAIEKNENYTMKVSYYHKDGKVLTRIVREEADKVTTLEFLDGKVYQTTKTISTGVEEKKVGEISNPGEGINLADFNFLETDSTWDFIKNIFTTSVIYIDDSWRIEGYKTAEGKVKPDRMDINPETGFIDKIYEGTKVTSYDININKVTDDMIKIEE